MFRENFGLGFGLAKKDGGVGVWVKQKSWEGGGRVRERGGRETSGIITSTDINMKRF